MVFTSPPHLPQLPEIPDSITVGEFLYDEKYGRHSIASSRHPYICGITGKSYSADEVVQRVDYLARAVGSRLNFNIAEGTEWDRVVCVYSLNTIDYIPLTHAIHRINGIVTPASAAFSQQELEQQLRSSGATAVFTCTPLLKNAAAAAKAVGISDDRIFLLPLPNETSHTYDTIDQLIAQGRGLSPLPSLTWQKGQGKRQTAFLSYSSGTSGMPKGVMVSHYNLIANVLQISALESASRKEFGIDTQVSLGVLPFSHIYGLTVISCCGTFRGDQIVVLPKFDFDAFLVATEKYKIEQLNVVPPIFVQILASEEKCAKFDLSSVRLLYSGAAPLAKETVDQLLKRYPKWRVGQGYGMTECSPGVSTTCELDLLMGSAGYILPGLKAKLIDAAGSEVTEHNTPGELLVQSPGVTLGYFNNERATAENYIWDADGRWLKTGDEVVIRKSPSGNEHIFVVDRIKELIKVKGHQVAPAELEAHILTHDLVSDCAVISVTDSRAGERPKAYIVKNSKAKGKTDEEVAAAVCKYVEDHKARHKWIKGGVEFIDVVPKSPSGKILRRVLRDMHVQSQKSAKAKL